MRLEHAAVTLIMASPVNGYAGEMVDSGLGEFGKTNIAFEKIATTNIKHLSYESGTNPVVANKKPASHHPCINAKAGAVFRNIHLMNFIEIFH